MTIPLAVTSTDIAYAKRLGAKWNKNGWYTEEDALFKDIIVMQFGIRDTPVALHGEDREFGGDILYIDLMPSTCWASTARPIVHPRDFDRVRRYIYARVLYKCECCGVDTLYANTRLQIHERWGFNIETRVRKLIRMMAVCQECHSVIHMPLSNNARAINHLRRVRGFSFAECALHQHNALDLWGYHSQYIWHTDVTLLTGNDILLNPNCTIAISQKSKPRIIE